MANQTDMPSTHQGIGTMLTALASNIPGALATKYNVTADQIASVTQAQLVRTWFDAAPGVARAWSVSLRG